MFELLIKIKNTLKFIPFLFFKSTSLENLLFPNFYFPRIIKVDVNNVVFITSIKKRRYFKKIFQNFDLDTLEDVSEKFSTCPKFITAKQILNEKKVIIDELAEYNFHLDNLIKKGTTRGFKTKELARNDIIDRINFYNRILKDGYQKKFTTFLNELNEINVALTCDSFVKVNAGNHRFAAFLILGINEVYASLVSIHSSLLSRYKSNFGIITILKIRNLIEKHSI